MSRLYEALQALHESLDRKVVVAHEKAVEMQARADVYEEVATRLQLLMRECDPAKQVGK